MRFLLTIKASVAISEVDDWLLSDFCEFVKPMNSWKSVGLRRVAAAAAATIGALY